MDLLRKRWPPTHVNLSQGEPKCPTPQRGCVGPRVETANLVGYQVYHRRRLGSRFKANWFARSPFVRHLDSFQYVGVGTMNWDATLTLDSRDE